MNKNFLNIFRSFSVVALAAVLCGPSWSAQAPNPRSAGATPRSDTRVVDVAQSPEGSQVSRAAANRRTVGATVSRSGTMVPVTVGAVTGRSAARQVVAPVASNRVATDVSAARSARTTPAVTQSTSAARSAHTPTTARAAAVSTVNVSRAASSARATALYDDVSKMGTGYATCREAYNTCMDQFCAKSNDTFRRCYCSSRYTDFIDTENALDEARTLLMQFQDNNLNAIDKTAAEVDAMYSATIGEQAIKNDTSAAQQTLSQIGDLLSGKKKAASKSYTSLSGLTLDFSTDLDDIWGEGGSSSNSIFGFNTGKDLSSLEGLSLYNEAHKQCMELVKNSCDTNAVAQMVKSSYGILITQDCNAYEKNITTKKLAIENTVREAEKILRDARLEEYRAHNSADVNECISKVKAAILNDNACGANYKRCLDYTGQYIDINTGDAIYSAHLQKLPELINLQASSATGDIVGQNPQFSRFLDQKKMYAELALDTCRDKADIVWNDFKRNALIEIAQAQDVKLQEVKDTCVETMANCYDKQSGGLAILDNTKSQATGALNAWTSRAMCADQVAACAAVYSNGSAQEKCEFDTNGRLTTPNCGLQALIEFVSAVDNVKVAEGCATAITGYVDEMCTPVSGTQKFPWKCRLRKPGTVDDEPNSGASATVAANIKNFAIQNCSDPTEANKSFDKLPLQTQMQIANSVSNVVEQLDYQMMEICEGLDGYWQDATETEGNLLSAFYSQVYGGDQNTDWGRCVENSTMIRCLAYNTDETKYATYDRTKDECTFTDDWFKVQCGLLGNGYYENGVCYVAP